MVQSCAEGGNVDSLTNLWLLSQGLLPIDSIMAGNNRRGSFEYRQSSLPPFNQFNELHNKLMFENARDSSDEEFVDVDSDNWPQQQFIRPSVETKCISAQEEDILQDQSADLTKSNSSLNVDPDILSSRTYVHRKGPAPPPPTIYRKEEDPQFLVAKENEEKAAVNAVKRETII